MTVPMTAKKDCRKGGIAEGKEAVVVVDGRVVSCACVVRYVGQAGSVADIAVTVVWAQGQRDKNEGNYVLLFNEQFIVTSSLTLSLPRCGLKRTNKGASFETFKPLFLLLSFFFLSFFR